MRIISEADFKKAAQKGAPIQGQMRKSHLPEPGPVTEDALKGVADLYRKRTGNDPDPGALLLPYDISSEARDRHGDTITLGGWDLDTWLAKSTILFAHDHRQPVARGIDAWISKKRLKSLGEFHGPEVSPFSYMCYQMALKGSLPASSVGFGVRDFEWEKDEKLNEQFFLPMNIKESELFEWSLVAVGSNRDSGVDHDVLSKAKSLGIDISPMADYVAELKDDAERAKDVWLSEKQLDTLYKGSRPQRTISIPESRWDDLNTKIDILTDEINTMKAAGLETPAGSDTGLETPDTPKTEPGLETPGQNAATCSSCDKNMPTNRETLAGLLSKLVNAIGDDTPRSEIIGDMAAAAGIEPSTVNQILDGDSDCPAMGGLEGFAKVLGVNVERLSSAAETGGRENEEKSQADSVLEGITLPQEEDLSVDVVMALLEKSEEDALSRVDTQVTTLMDQEMLQLTGRLPD